MSFTDKIKVKPFEKDDAPDNISKKKKYITSDEKVKKLSPPHSILKKKKNCEKTSSSS